MEQPARERAGHAPTVVPTWIDRALRPLHRWVWRDPRRRARKLLRFAETEDDGGRDLSRAAERTADALLRRLYLRHARDEQRHAQLFRDRGLALLRTLPPDGAAPAFEAAWLAPGERGLDDLRVDEESEASLLAFLHLSERAAARRFVLYREFLALDPPTRDVFTAVLRDEVFHMNYTRAQLLRTVASPRAMSLQLLRARAARAWRAYLRVAVALASVIGGLLLIVQALVLLPPFALLARRAARREPAGWHELPAERPPATSQY